MKKTKMKKVTDLIWQAVDMGIDRERAIEYIDASLDNERGAENRQPLDKEELTEKEYQEFLDMFESIIEGRE